MSRIGATISGIEQYLLTQLARVDKATIQSSIRLATGKKVGRPADDPSAFFQISRFQQQLEIVNTTKSQVEIAASIGSQTQLTLDQIRTQLTAIRDTLLQDEDQSLTAAQREANQGTIDAAIHEINVLANTELGGRRYLNGSVNYRLSGKNSSQVQEVSVFSVRENIISGSVTSAATQASVTYNGGGGSKINSGNATFVLSGKRGSTTISVTNNEQLTAVRDRINRDSHKTGITASVAGNKLVFTTVDYGESATIDIDVTAGTFTTTGTTQGADAVATINGVNVSSNNVDGNRVTFNQNGLHFTIAFQPGFTGAFDTITVTDEGVSKFALTTNVSQITRLGLPGVMAAQFQGVSGALDQLASGGSLAGLGSNTSQAIRVVDEALERLTLIEGRVDAFADVTVASSSALLDGFKSTLEDTLEDLDGVNEDEESLLLAKNQSLGSNTIAAITILQQQQASVLALVHLLAGI